MIVMKFGGSSVESASAMRRVAAIVKEHRGQNPVVVVSAMGKTTGKLLELAQEASRGHVYFVSSRLSELQDVHFDAASEAASGEALERLEASLQRQFRDLHLLLSEITGEGRELTPTLLDEIASYGERMSSEIMAAALEAAGVASVHVDARRVILTDDQFTRATPLYWETYARLRRLPEIYSGRVAVMGGFIGATESGATTTLGRGGSDLTASIVGAGISAAEIQIWTDVDGMLTTDPRVGGEFHRLRSISYEEAAEMARCGAKVLHPSTVMPAIRQHIPVVIRNSRNPANEGTRIGPRAAGSEMVKSIACREDVMVLELRREGGRAIEAEELEQMCGNAAECIGRSAGAAFLMAHGSQTPGRELFEGCVQVRIHPHAAVLTLVGDRVADAAGVVARVRGALQGIRALMIEASRSAHAMVIVVAQSELHEAAARLHREFFSSPDPAIFAPCRAAVVDRVEESKMVEEKPLPFHGMRLALELGRSRS